MIAPNCDSCGDEAPYGDERNWWLGYHQSWSHKTYWRLKKKILCFVWGHDWDEYRGFYNEKPTDTAICNRCEIKYKETLR